ASTSFLGSPSALSELRFADGAPDGQAGAGSGEAVLGMHVLSALPRDKARLTGRSAIPQGSPSAGSPVRTTPVGVVVCATGPGGRKRMTSAIRDFDDDALDLLDRFLMSDRAPENGLAISDFDGFLTAIVVGPELIMPSEWLRGRGCRFAELREPRRGQRGAWRDHGSAPPDHPPTRPG